MIGDARSRSRQVLQDPSAKILHLGLLERWLLPGLLFGFCAWGATELFRSGSAADVVQAVIMLVLSGTLWFLLFRIALAYTDQDVLVRNLRSRTVPRHDVISATPSYEGLVLRTFGGQRLKALAVQEYNIALMLGTRTKAARIAGDLLNV